MTPKTKLLAFTGKFCIFAMPNVGTDGNPIKKVINKLSLVFTVRWGVQPFRTNPILLPEGWRTVKAGLFLCLLSNTTLLIHELIKYEHGKN